MHFLCHPRQERFYVGCLDDVRLEFDPYNGNCESNSFNFSMVNPFHNLICLDDKSQKAFPISL